MDYNQLTVAKLKDELKDRGIPTTNLKLKKDIIDRLIQDDAEKDHHQSLSDSTAQRNAPSESPRQPDDPSPLTADPQPAHSPKLEATVDTNVPIDQHDAHSLPSLPSALPASSTEHPEEPPAAVPNLKDEVDSSATPAPVQFDEPTSGEGKKRKRRSQSPAVDEEVIQKKLKQEVDAPAVHLQADQHVTKNDHVPMPDVSLEQAVQPMSTSDDLVPLSTKDSDKSRSTRSPNERRLKDLVNPAESDAVHVAPEPAHVSVSPAIHPATRALYIRHLVRPINPSGLRDHLEDVAKPPDHSAAPASMVEDCYVDALRTHAFVLFTSISAASRARASTHARIWPAEPMRKPLWVDFLPEEHFHEWIETERASGGSRPSQARRWELAYHVTGDDVDVRLVEAGPAQHRPSIPTGAPNAPTGPRASMSSGRRPSFPQEESRRPSQPILPPHPPPRRSSKVVEEASAPFLELDKLFKFTTTKPKLYWQPVSDNLADDRLDELDRETSRDWDPRKDLARNGDSLGRGLDQLKRYTFEDGDVLVDGGPEFGGGRAFARNGNRGRGRRNGDSYRGN